MNQKEFEKHWIESEKYADKIIHGMENDGLTEREVTMVIQFLDKKLNKIRNVLSEQRFFCIPEDAKGDK